MSERGVVLVRVLAAVAVLGASAGVFAQDRAGSIARPGSPRRGERTPGASAPGGAPYNVSTISSLAFSPLYSGVTFASAPDNFKFAASGADFGAGASLPAGAVIDYIGLASCDEAGGNLSVWVYWQPVGGAASLVDAVVTSAHGAASPCGMDFSPSPLAFAIPSNSGASLQLDVRQDFSAPTDASVRFGSVEIWWRPSVGPAPATASFLDVPTSDPFFQFVEALRSSGITAGCTDSVHFCPDQPVLRKQMAVFLAKALGLGWGE